MCPLFNKCKNGWVPLSYDGSKCSAKKAFIICDIFLLSFNIISVRSFPYIVRLLAKLFYRVWGDNEIILRGSNIITRILQPFAHTESMAENARACKKTGFVN
jgi:hypothetical protein